MQKMHTYSKYPLNLWDESDTPQEVAKVESIKIRRDLLGYSIEDLNAQLDHALSHFGVQLADFALAPDGTIEVFCPAEYEESFIQWLRGGACV